MFPVLPNSLLLLLLLFVVSACNKKPQSHDRDFEAIRINCGGEDRLDKRTGHQWLSDKDFVIRGKQYHFKNRPSLNDLPDTAPKEVYQSARRAAIRYRFEDVPDGIYQLRLHFMDDKRHEKRRMEFWADGTPILQNFNIKEAAGGEIRAAIFDTFIEVTGGDGLELKGLKGRGDDVVLSAIEILKAPVGTKPTPVVLAEAHAPSDFQTQLRTFAGGPVRLVWTQTANEDDYYQQSDSGVLMGYDSEDTKGERVILPTVRSYAMPMFTPDGEKIIFTDQRKRMCFEVGFDGTNLRPLVEGYASDVWTDHATSRTWIYVRTGWRNTSAPVCRYDLADLSKKELVWGQSATGINQASWFTISGDGRQAADGFPWPKCGIADVQEKDLKVMGKGCWPSVAPDASGKYFYFIGKHTALQFFDSREEAPRPVNLATIPGWTGRKLYHPRWTNDARFITATAPQWMPETELYLGRFDAGFKEIERWFRVTYNHQADYFGDAWFAAAAGEIRAPSRSAPVTIASPVAKDHRGLIFVWENERAKNAVLDDAGKVKKIWSASYDGHSRPNRHYGADLKNGGLVPSDDAGPAIASRIQGTGAISLVVDLIPRTTDALEGTVVYLGDAAGRTVMAVDQVGPALTVKFDQGSVGLKLAGINAGQEVQLAINHDGKTLTACINGEQTASHQVESDIRKWKVDRLIFGRNTAPGSYWEGSLENIRIFERTLTPDEISGLYATSKAAWEKRQPAPGIVVEAELVEASDPADPDAIAPYTRSLGENLYRITKVVSGDLAADKVVVLQWVILGGKELDSQREKGRSYRLVLEPEAAHPELSGEHRSTDLFELDAPVFYDTDS